MYNRINEAKIVHADLESPNKKENEEEENEEEENEIYELKSEIRDLKAEFKARTHDCMCMAIYSSVVTTIIVTVVVLSFAVKLNIF